MKKEELIKKLKEMPDNTNVFIMTAEEGCTLVQDVFYSDTLGDEDDNQNWDGIIISNKKESNGK